MKQIFLILVPGIVILTSCRKTGLPDSLSLSYPSGVPQVEFAVEQISRASASSGIKLYRNAEHSDAEMHILLAIDEGLGYEACKIDPQENRIVISGGDANGLMYAGIDLAEAIALNKDLTSLEETEVHPYIRHRGLRYNIPLDARTPSYDDTGDAAQKNILTVWDLEYWKEYLDRMALNRYNLLTIWSLHPYPSMVKVPEYPDVALDDVCVYNKEIDASIVRDWIGVDIQDPENLDVILEMSMDEKIAHWKKVFQHAKDRGIDIYLFHWNVYVNGAEGKHGIEWSQDNDITMDYLRKSVKAMLLTYPDIKGIGVTAGEHTDRSQTGKYKIENWIWHTYGQGVMDAKTENPGLDVRFIFRRHQSDFSEIAGAFRDYPGGIETSFKYSRARMYSSTTPPWFDKNYRETVERYGVKCWLNVRNDDIFVFRWGDPEYARDYILNMPRDLSPGFYMGPDGYVWGREFISKQPQNPRQLEVDKHWYRFRIWGRTAYHPDLTPEYWQDQLKLRFPEADAGQLYETWKASSEIISLVDKIHFRQNDLDFSPEGCFDRNGFHDVNMFIKVAAMPLQGVVSISDYAKSNGDVEGITPFELADRLNAAADILINGAASMDPAGNPELKETLGDMAALGYLGRYYSRKVRGATRSAMYRWSGKEEDRSEAIKALEEAVDMWARYSEIARSQYDPQLLARTRRLDWEEVLTQVKEDVEIARSAKHGESIEIEYDNILWERDAKRFL